jgi:transposase-like protein
MEKDNKANRYSPETRARAVRMVLDNQGSYESQSAAIKAIARRLAVAVTHYDVGFSRKKPTLAVGMA